MSGPLFHFGDTWQRVINTSTTIVTFLMVFLIQNTHNRDTAAMQIKLDARIRAVDGVHDALLDLEELDEKGLERFRKHYERLAERARGATELAAQPPAAVDPARRPWPLFHEPFGSLRGPFARATAAAAASRLTNP